MRILVAIASYGTKNDHFLHRLIEEYRTFPHDVHIVVLSNQEKPLPPKVELKVGIPISNPWSLPFAHKPIFAERKNDFDLFIYSEDDTPITLKNLEAFLRYTQSLPEDQIAGFLRYEAAPDGKQYISSAHAHFHWLAESARKTEAGCVARFTNEHAAAYVITKKQLHRALASGGFHAPPREGRYDMLCTAATDVYTQCGFQKVVSVSDFDDFLLHHLPNKYVGRMGVSLESFKRMIAVVEQIAMGKHPKCNLAPVLSEGDFDRWLPRYYEDVQGKILDAVPVEARSVLVLGCGWGMTEEALMKRGHRVQALPLDSVVGVLAADRGVEVHYEKLSGKWGDNDSELYDCIVVNGLVHLVEDPFAFLKRCAGRLQPKGALVVRAPNFGFLPWQWYRLKNMPGFSRYAPFSATGVNPHSLGKLRGWLRASGLKLDHETLTPGETKRVPKGIQPWLPKVLLSVEAVCRAHRA